MSLRRSKSFVAASTLFSSRLVCLVCPNGDPRVRRHENGAAIAYLERVRPPARAGIAQSLEVRAVVVARFRGDGRVAKLRVGRGVLVFGQGGMTKAETDARWLTGRARASNARGGAYLLPHARELAR